MKRTPWFPVKTKPVRRGLYEFRWPGGRTRKARWDGRYWFEWIPKLGGFTYFAYHLFNNEEWRGLLQHSSVALTKRHYRTKATKLRPVR
jgi:hypothetical protein